MATATGRTIIKTDIAGWFLDPESGKKTRQKDGDNVVTQEEFDAIKAGKKDTTTERIRAAVAESEVPTTTLTTGKRVTGQTVTIKCAWVDPDKRTPEQVKLFEGDPKEITYENVKAAAGNKRSAFPDGTERTIKPQDQFQVRFKPENQKKWRAELRRRKNKARREAARAAAKA